MNCITADRARLDQAVSLPDILDAAYDTFEDILAVLRHHQELAGDGFPAFVLAAGTAATGRDWIADAPSLPPAPVLPRRPATSDDLLAGRHWADVALEVAQAGRALARKLSASAASAPDPEDRASCEGAAGYAARISKLLGGARQP